jgi:hypothetical protein
MNFITAALGIVLIATGFVTLVHKLHDRSIHETLDRVKFPHGDVAAGVSAFVGLLVPIVSSIAGGIAFLLVGLLGIHG